MARDDRISCSRRDTLAVPTGVSSERLSMCPQKAPVPLKHVRDGIDAALIDGRTSLRQVANGLGVSVRTLQRSLSSRGVTYTELLEAARYEQACRQLERLNQTIGETSRQLGYRDPSNFSRAFQRWSGQSPRAWRQLKRGPPSK